MDRVAKRLQFTNTLVEAMNTMHEDSLHLSDAPTVAMAILGLKVSENNFLLRTQSLGSRASNSSFPPGKSIFGASCEMRHGVLSGCLNMS